MRKLLAVWLLILAAAQAFAFVKVREYFVFTEDGQRLDWIALSGNYIGARHTEVVVGAVLNATSAAAVLGATLFVGFIALIRRRVLLAVTATLLVAGANITAQLLKRGTERPDLGVDMERITAGNSLPSGHTTLAASIAIALILVLPAQVRALGALVGAAYAALAGIATLSAGWHRPSDAVASLLIVGAWASVASAVLLLFQRDDGFADTQHAHRAAILTLIVVAAISLGAAALALHWVHEVITVPPDDLSRRRLLAAYGGSAAGIVGVAALVTALFLSSVHQVVPRRAATS